MPDILVRLYDLEPVDAALAALPEDVVIRRALPPERDRVLDWIGARFGAGWRAEAGFAFAGHPVNVFIAVKGDALLGFACIEATARGFFGPTGVDEGARGGGIGSALLMAALAGLRERGYAYAVIGDPGPVDFYLARLPASLIPDSTPGLYRGLLAAGTQQ